jgi:hypothetical protein
MIMMYDNHVYNQDKKSIQVQHKYADVISTPTHFRPIDCLETIIVKGESYTIYPLNSWSHNDFPNIPAHRSLRSLSKLSRESDCGCCRFC